MPVRSLFEESLAESGNVNESRVMWMRAPAGVGESEMRLQAEACLPVGWRLGGLMQCSLIGDDIIFEFITVVA